MAACTAQTTEVAGLASAEDRTTAIFVLGPGRTGTSLTARILNLAGVYLGAEEELLSRTGIPANPTGFWEHRGLSRVNQRVLQRLGGSWSRPPPLPPGWENSPELEPEREEARALLERAFGGHRLWGWKDGRNSLTLPFWRPLLSDGRFDVRYVICLRNPVDVAASLTPPEPLSKGEKIDLWLTYVAAALVNTSGRPRLLLPYESYFADWRGTVERLLAFAGCAMPAPRSEAESRMREFTDPALWRHRTSVEEAMQDPDMSEQASALYLTTELLALSGPEPDTAELADAYAQRLLAEGPAG